MSKRFPRSSWPTFLKGELGDFHLAPAVALARGDTSALRAAANMLDSVGASTAAAFTIDAGASLIAADAYLILRDSTRALAAVRRMLDVLMTSSPADGGYPSHWIAGGWRALPEQSHDDEDQYDDEENVNGVAGVRDLRYSRVAKEPQ